MKPLTRTEYNDTKTLLAEGFHTAFRKASDHPNAHQIWLLIRELPSDDWGNVIDFVASGTFRVAKPKAKRKRVTR